MNQEIVKVCKKHGNLTKDQVIFHGQLKTKVSYLCKECVNTGQKKRNHSPDRKKKAEEMRQLLAEGKINKICSKHGQIPHDRIRINSRAEVVCRICVNEIKERSVNKDKEAYLKKQKEWRKKNPDKMRQYAENYRPRRHVVAAKIYKKWMKDPKQREKLSNWKKKSSAKSRKELSDSYVQTLIKSVKTGGRKNKQYYYIKSDIPKDLIEVKRLQVKFSRQLRKNRKENKNVD